MSMNEETGYLLIVEDDRDIRQLLDTRLSYSGYRVVTAPNGNDGLKVITENRPDVVITDIMMPRLDGFGLVHRIRINPETRDIPVVFITSTYVTPEDQEFALNIGATRFIQKPLDFDKLLATIAEVLHQGLPAAFEPLQEFDFYEGYRVRLQSKLDQKKTQMARDELLLGTHSEGEDQSLQASMRLAAREQEEIEFLLKQLNEQIDSFHKSQ